MTKRNFAMAFGTLAGVCLLCGMGSTMEIAKAPAATYTNPAYGISVNAPECDAKKGSDATLAIFYVADKGAHLGNVNIGVHLISTTRAEWLRAVLANVAAQGQKVNSQKMLEVNGRDAFIIDSQGQIEKQDWHFLALSVIDKNRVIVITGTAPADKYDQALPKFEEVFRSVALAG